MTDHWADIFVRILYLSGFALLLLACILMAIGSYVTEKSRKPSRHFKTAVKAAFGLWFINNIALFAFGIMAEWFSLQKWEMWVTYAVAFLVGLGIWLISRKEPKAGRNVILFSLLLLATLIIGAVFGVALMTGRY